MAQSPQQGNGIRYLYGLINFVVVFCLVWLLWYIFMNPNGVMKLYTPMYGFALVVQLLFSVVLLSKVLEVWPPAEGAATGSGRIGRGVVLTVGAVVLMYVLNYGIFWNFIGQYGVAYFSPESIVASGGTGAEPFNARENASTAIVYFATAFLWVALIWAVGFGRWPWTETSRRVAAWSRFFTVMFFTILVFDILFHPHVCHLFYPAQDKAGVAPWWDTFAGTGSAFFSLGLLLCALSWVVLTDLQWEGYPWKLFERNGQGTAIKGIVTFVVSFILGVISCVIMLKIMNHYWMEPFVGGQYTDAPYFRYLHAGEISGFFILAAFILAVYFRNFPNTGSLFLNGIVRTAIVIAGGYLIRLFYYSKASTYVIGKVPGVAQPDDTPLVWTILFLSVIMIQNDFFLRWPLSPPEELRPKEVGK